MKVDRNWDCYQRLNPRRYAGRYVVIVGGKVVGSGKNLRKLLLLAGKRRPGEIPFVARMRHPGKVCVYPGSLNA